jgi:hypothetical protein
MVLESPRGFVGRSRAAAVEPYDDLALAKQALE